MDARPESNISATVNAHSREEWSEIAARFADSNIYQTWEYEESRDDAAKTQVSRVVVARAGRPIGIAQVRVKRIPILGGGLAYLYRGPLWRTGGSDANDLAEVLRQLRAMFCTAQGLTLRVVPNATTATGDSEWKSGLRTAGFQPERRHKRERTIMLGLEQPLDALRKQLAQKWRNCLNQAERNALAITQSTTSEDWQHFETLYDTMLAEKQFETGVSVAAFRRLQELLGDGRKMQVLLAWQNGVPIAGHVSSRLGDTCIYLLGASGDAARQTKAAYLLQWQAVTLAHASGARWYDLGGIDPDANPGVYHFKCGLGGVEAEFCGSYTAAPTNARKYLVPIAEAAYRRCRAGTGAK